MLIYVYDGSFEGVLTSIYEAYYNKEKPDRILPIKNLQKNMLAEYKEVKTSREKFMKVYEAIKLKISNQSLRNIYRVYLSENMDLATLIYGYVRIGFKIGNKVESYLQNYEVRKVIDISKAVAFEAHRFLGLIRFKEIEGGIFFAEFKPDYNISPLIAGHFARRFSDQNWIINDVKRDICIVYNKSKWFLTDSKPKFLLNTSINEEMFENLWKEYFCSISIKERKNLYLQRSFMPKKYWNYLIEKKVF